MMASKGMPDIDHGDMARLKKELKSGTENRNEQREEQKKKYMNQEQLLLVNELKKTGAMKQHAEFAVQRKVQREGEDG